MLLSSREDVLSREIKVVSVYNKVTIKLEVRVEGGEEQSIL